MQRGTPVPHGNTDGIISCFWDDPSVSKDETKCGTEVPRYMTEGSIPCYWNDPSVFKDETGVHKVQ